MWGDIKKWWNREWSNWREYDVVNTYRSDRLIGKEIILKRTSNDGLCQTKLVKLC